MRSGAGVLSTVRADKGGIFWLWFGVKLTLGLAQMVGSVLALLILLREGPSIAALRSFLLVAVLTTLSMLLFKVLGWKPVKR